jgi:hypothetical protein
VYSVKAIDCSWRECPGTRINRRITRVQTIHMKCAIRNRSYVTPKYTCPVEAAVGIGQAPAQLHIIIAVPHNPFVFMASQIYRNFYSKSLGAAPLCCLKGLQSPYAIFTPSQISQTPYAHPPSPPPPHIPPPATPTHQHPGHSPHAAARLGRGSWIRLGFVWGWARLW